MKNLFINLNNSKIEIIEKDIFPIDWGLYWHNKFETYKYDVYDYRNVFTFGTVGLPVYGGHRLTFCFKSPLTDNFFFSSMGGAGYQFLATGYNNVAIVGRAKKPSLLIISDKSIDIVEIREDFRTVYEIYNHIVEHYKERNLRAIVVGEASKKTALGALFSQTVLNNKVVEGSEDWAARGGGGSVLYQAHNLAGIVYFGDKNEEKALKDKVKEIVEEYYKESYINVVKKFTKKYRYNDESQTGGTFGNNWLIYKEKVPIFNWQMPYISKEERKKLLNIILENYLKIFNQEAIETKSWKNCGEPCPVVCKKYRNKNKVDYEPYAANGTLLGIFDLHEADKVVKEVDSLGFDAIEVGNLTAFVFESLYRGLLKEEELNIKTPYFNYKDILEGDIKEISRHNSEQAIKFLNNLANNYNRVYKILSLGTRKAVKLLDEMYKSRTKEIKFKDIAVYIALGDCSSINPNLYWSPGFFMPLVISGRYLTYYKPEFLEPEELAEKIYENVKLELALDNLTICRFHRKWLKPVINKIVSEIFNIDFNYEKYSLELYKKIYEYNKKCIYPNNFESERVKDLLVGLAKECGNKNWNKENIDNYLKRFLDKYSELFNIDWKIK
ncbi:aldehyde ferredoxin oxidoreductase N-terminal domain-containing protein [Methanocaldococcus indicus]|uniref:aldehyde ferredoxin oxidoreductase N-terminal domain-containing protein n=1 Tax=Methanocaldococcus indicus TaxID=213231 RepID=UPI003C6D7E57